jgi:hypothetical protein
MRHTPKKTFDPLSSWLVISFFGLIVVCVVAAMSVAYFGRRGQRLRENWPSANGSPTGTRIVREPPTERFPITMYVGECSVEYTVADKQYSVWVASGYLDQDPKFIADKMQECPVSRYAIHYNPQNPADSFGERLDGPP